MKFKDGCVVHKMWLDGNSELLASFQYESDAWIFCNAPRDKSDGAWWLVLTNLHDGAQYTFGHTGASTDAPAESEKP